MIGLVIVVGSAVVHTSAEVYKRAVFHTSAVLHSTPVRNSMHLTSPADGAVPVANHLSAIISERSLSMEGVSSTLYVHSSCARCVDITE